MSSRTISPIEPDLFALIEPQVVLQPITSQPFAPEPVAPQPVALHKDPFVIDLATTALHDLTDRIPSVLYATVLTEDGFEVDGVPAFEEDKLSSMASSLQGLSEAVVRELTMGRAHYMIIAAENGNVVQIRVPGQHLVLAAVFGLDETVGNALATCQLAADRFATALADR